MRQAAELAVSHTPGGVRQEGRLVPVKRQPQLREPLNRPAGVSSTTSDWGRGAELIHAAWTVVASACCTAASGASSIVFNHRYARWEGQAWAFAG